MCFVRALLGILASSVAWAGELPPEKCLRVEDLAEAQAILQGNAPGGRPNEGTPTVQRLSNGSYVILVPGTRTDSPVSILYTPVDAANPSKGFRVQRRVDATGEITQSFSDRPPVSTVLIREANQARLIQNRIKDDIIGRYLTFHQIPDARMEECRRLVRDRSPKLEGNELDLMAASYAVATLPTAVDAITRGAASRRYTRERLRQLIDDENNDYDTISDETHQRLADTLGALRTLNKGGFADVVKPIRELALQTVLP